MGAGLVLRIWVTVCIVGGPLTLAVCIIGFPEYWPIAAGAVVLATGIGAAIGGASAGRVPCPAPPPAASASPGLVGPQVQRQGADPG
jgi:hypothetical protein